MKAFVLSLFAVVALSSATSFAAEEVVNLQEIQENFVVEPIFEANRLSCPSDMMPIAKYCWNTGRGCFVKCGVVCHPKRETPPPVPEPHFVE
ncbi:hypothetical protein ACNQKP_17580 [Bdellovibrio bacteriovorus]|uniref:hypothetical protein n=1 Tax=Bdellovibrio bacteriovorus TaxID=959 RepID=UPI003AA855A4